MGQITVFAGCSLPYSSTCCLLPISFLSPPSSLQVCTDSSAEQDGIPSVRLTRRAQGPMMSKVQLGICQSLKIAGRIRNRTMGQMLYTALHIKSVPISSAGCIVCVTCGAEGKGTHIDTLWKMLVWFDKVYSTEHHGKNLCVRFNTMSHVSDTSPEFRF